MLTRSSHDGVGVNTSALPWIATSRYALLAMTEQVAVSCLRAPRMMGQVAVSCLRAPRMMGQVAVSCLRVPLA